MTVSISACTRAGRKEQGSAKVQEKKPNKKNQTSEQRVVVAVRVPQEPTWDTCHCLHLFCVSAGGFPFSLSKKETFMKLRGLKVRKNTDFC